METNEFYTPEGCQELITALLDARESIKHLLSCHKGKEENKLITPELLEAYSNLANECEELISTYDYCIEAGLWKAANEEEHKARMMEHFLQMVAEDKAGKQD